MRRISVSVLMLVLCGFEILIRKPQFDNENLLLFIPKNKNTNDHSNI
jgi:hypothetical protein